MSSVSHPRIVLLSYFGLEGIILCHFRGLDIQPPGTDYDRVDLCMCEFLLDAVWTPTLGEKLNCRKDDRKEAKQHDEYAIKTVNGLNIGVSVVCVV